MLLDKECYIVRNGASKYSIAVPQNASEVEEHVAQELRNYILKATGAALPVVREEAVLSPCIYVGHTAFARKNGVAGSGEENWNIAVFSENVILCGGLNPEQRGNAYAVYHFLEDCVGVRWWNHAEEYIPSLSELKIRADYHQSGTPLFPYRKVVASYGHTDFYCSARNRLNVVGSGDNVIDGAFNRSVCKTGGAYYAAPPSHVHTLSAYFPVEEYFQSHPDWWGWDEMENRRRSDRQHCLCNEEFYDAMLEKLLSNIRSAFREAEKCGIARPHFFSVSLSDDQLYCQCPACVASVAQSGRSGHNLKFVNRLARTVREQYPEAVLETLAYWDYIEPPLDDTVPEQNVIIRLAYLQIDVTHDVTYPTNQVKLKLLRQWVELCRKSGAPLYTWEYMIHEFSSIPIPFMYQLPVNYRAFYEMGITGCFVEHELYIMPDFWGCTQWLLCKYLENPYIDFDEALDDFLSKYYGKAADAMRRYLDLLYGVVQKSPLHIALDQTCSNWNYVTPELVREGLLLFDEAFASVRGDTLREQRLREASLPLYRCIAIQHEDFVRVMRQRGLDFALPSAAEAAERVLEALDELKDKYAYHIGATSVHQDQLLLDRIRVERGIFRRIRERETTAFTIPKMLAGVKEEDIYNIPAYQIIRFFETQNIVTEREDAASDSAIVLRYRAEALGFTDALTDPAAWRLPIVLVSHGKTSRTLLISQEELSSGQYEWFCMENVTEVCHDSNIYLYVRESNGLVIRLSPLATCFPFKSCDIYVRVRAEGHSFGGAQTAENAIYFDRFVIVRRY